ncbi:MAG TPA: helix-turn-helix transcriptional regulator [Candidatus Binatia bacterium]|jgi:DNA-binding XRE family transcriptional regulator|nr:helix-turn-helix transcriptional regulator [Candidatus Binatia bacterium]
MLRVGPRSDGVDHNNNNNVKKIRESKMLSKTELARLAGISPLTLDRIERGKACRLSTKRKVLLALGLKISQKHRVFRQ